MRKNAPYPLYHIVPEINDLRELLRIKLEEQPNDVAFRYMRGRNTVVERTYSTFYHDVEALGTYLLKRGVRGRKIAIIGENSYRWLVAYCAIINTGNVAVLIAKDASKTEVATLLFQSDADIVLASHGCSDIAEFCKSKFAKKKRFFSMTEMGEWLEKGRAFLEKGKHLYDKVEIDPNALCTIFFTSGTSGVSKGVMLSHQNMAADISLTTCNFRPSGVSMAVLPFNHAFGLVTSVFKAFHYGHPVFICSNLANFMREIPIAKPQTLFVVPLFIETFSKTIWRTAEKSGQDKKLRRGMKISDALLKVGIDKRKTLFDAVLSKFGGNLEYIICGGAPLDPRFVKEFRSFGIEILNGYGITECSPVLSVNRNHHSCDGSVGLPIPETQIVIDHPDEKGQGEIIVKGRNVMLGYYNDEKATEEVMKDGWFHTGDLGYINEDGFLFVTGRAKNLIILANGENVSPEEIEQYVERIPEVQEVVVYEDGRCITAEIYPEETDLSKDELRKVLEKRIQKMNAELPNHKHVGKIVIRDSEFEKTATKKIKRYKATAKKKAEKATGEES